MCQIKYKIFFSGEIFRNYSFQGETKRRDFQFLKQLQCHLKLKGNEIKSVLHRQSSSVLQINYKGTQTQQVCAKPALSSQDYRFRHTPYLVPKPAQAEKLQQITLSGKEAYETLLTEPVMP